MVSTKNRIRMGKAMDMLHKRKMIIRKPTRETAAALTNKYLASNQYKCLPYRSPIIVQPKQKKSDREVKTTEYSDLRIHE